MTIRNHVGNKQRKSAKKRDEIDLLLFQNVLWHKSENFLESAPLKGALWKVEGRECEGGEKKREEGENVPEGSRKSALDSNETI